MIGTVIDVFADTSSVGLAYSLVAGFPIRDAVIAQRDMIIIATADLTKCEGIRLAHNSDRSVFEIFGPCTSFSSDHSFFHR
jgi:hypothetical protein